MFSRFAATVEADKKVVRIKILSRGARQKFCRLPRRRDESDFGGSGDRRRTVCHPEFGEYAPNSELDGSQTIGEVLGYLRVGPSRGDLVQDLHFSGRQRFGN